MTPKDNSVGERRKIATTINLPSLGTGSAVAAFYRKPFLSLATSMREKEKSTNSTGAISLSRSVQDHVSMMTRLADSTAFDFSETSQ